MDILLSIVQLSKKEFTDYVAKIKASNLDKMTQGELINLLETALQQTQQAKNMGWL